MLPRTEKHEFLASLHRLCDPWSYLEIGVQTGTSLSLAHQDKCRRIAVDPSPMVDDYAAFPNTTFFTGTADQFFASHRREDFTDRFDLTFIDGSHLVEDAYRDFWGAEHFSHEHSLIVFDDVLPYSDAIAHRVPLPGDWAGDVWKMRPILGHVRPELRITMVDVKPTGLMVVQGLDPERGPQIMRDNYEYRRAAWAVEMDSTEWLANLQPMQPAEALDRIRSYL